MNSSSAANGQGYGQPWVLNRAGCESCIGIVREKSRRSGAATHGHFPPYPALTVVYCGAHNEVDPNRGMVRRLATKYRPVAEAFAEA